MLNNVSFDYDDFNEAYASAEKNADKDDLILVFGSFFLVSEYLARLKHT
jgi:dihydrofolate synthase/folylpolyglutamate synthase